jgi:hypothetical protein
MSHSNRRVKGGTRRSAKPAGKPRHPMIDSNLPRPKRIETLLDMSDAKSAQNQGPLGVEGLHWKGRSITPGSFLAVSLYQIPTSAGAGSLRE